MPLSSPFLIRCARSCHCEASRFEFIVFFAQALVCRRVPGAEHPLRTHRRHMYGRT